MLHRFQRHPFPVVAHFDHCLVLTYAVPAVGLRAYVPCGMEPDAHGGLGFVAAAFVQTRGLRPEFLPSCCGQDFFLSGYRVFVRHRTPDGRTLRGLRILRSDANRRGMVWGGNFLTHYNYSHCRASLQETGGAISISVDTACGEADASVTAILSAE